MILAAGRGTRLLPLTETLPKALVPIAGKPMIHYSLHFLAANGIRDVVINLHHLGSMIEEALGDGRDFELRISYSHEEKLLDTGGGIKKARPFFKNETFLVMNCDFLAEIDLNEVAQFHRSKQAVGTLVLRDDSEVERYGPIETDEEGKICRLLSWGTPGRHRRMFAGIQILEPKVFEFMPFSEPFGITHDTYPLMLQHGEMLWGYEFSGPWFDLGTPDGIRKAEEAIRCNEN
jgi:NDP-sugar pyrophosphorylase family protein